jgi:peroxiredoxin
MSANPHADKIAALLAFILGAPFAFMMVQGFAEGEVRRKEIPLRAMLGDETYEGFRDLRDGEKMPKAHYLGNNLRAPDFELRDQKGKLWKLSDHRGKTVVMNFRTFTCGPCVEEMPSLEQLALIAESRDDLEVVAVTTDRSWKVVKSLFKPGSKLRVLFDPGKLTVRDKYGTKLYPETWIIDEEGVIRARVDGARDWSSALAIDMIDAASS